jgi:crotonobetainyl-CoA:carnitine CoA-transferase CaiB-like acyl-CoA transferase
MESFGLSYEELEKVNPNLVMTSISNFGQTGPYRDYKSSDMVTYAMGGLLHITGVEDANPVKIGNYAALCLGGGTAAATTMCTFFGARYQDIGQHLDISLMETIVGSMDRGGPNLVSAAYSDDLLMFRAGAFRASALPLGSVPTADGYIWSNTAASMYVKFCQLIGHPELIEQAQRLYDPTFFEEMDAAFLPWTLARGKTEIMEEGGGLIAITALNTVADVVANKHFREREFFQEIDHPVAGKFEYPGPLFRMTETPWRKGRAPLLGEHNQEILGNLGYSKDDLVKLRETGVI